MPFPLLGIAAGALAAKGASKLFGHKSKTKANDEQRRATAAGLNVAQKQREDARRARLALGSSLMAGVPKTTAGGGVNTNLDLDPELLAKLGAERTYDFESAVPDANKGATWALLSGLFGDVGDFGVDYAMGGGQYGAGQAVNAGPLNPAATGPLSGGAEWDRAASPGGQALGGGNTVSWEDLFNLRDGDTY